MPPTTGLAAHTLVPSTIWGRYALDHPTEGRDLTSGDSVAILIGGRWVSGSVEYACVSQEHLVPGTYATDRTSGTLPMINGYYFCSAQGEILGLCVGMRVRPL